MRATELLRWACMLIEMLLLMTSIDQYAVAVTPDYCFAALNRSDCKMAPTPVFYFYKPGARCEMALYRGCPTENAFPNLYLCMHTCIFRMSWTGTDEEMEPIAKTEFSCADAFDAKKCTNQQENVYTYNTTTEQCEQATWRGCRNLNMFPDLSTCTQYCTSNLEQNENIDDWEKELIDISEKDAEDVNKMLDDVIGDKVKLKKEAPVESPAHDEPSSSPAASEAPPPPPAASEVVPTSEALPASPVPPAISSSTIADPYEEVAVVDYK